MKATHSIYLAKAAIICMGTLGFSSLSICAENSTQGDAEKCVKLANLEPDRSTEMLPKGVCPIRVNFGPNSYSSTGDIDLRPQIRAKLRFRFILTAAVEIMEVQLVITCYTPVTSPDGSLAWRRLVIARGSN